MASAVETLILRVENATLESCDIHHDVVVEMSFWESASEGTNTRPGKP
jgi:hypothetical protein